MSTARAGGGWCCRVRASHDLGTGHQRAPPEDASSHARPRPVPEPLPRAGTLPTSAKGRRTTGGPLAGASLPGARPTPGGCWRARRSHPSSRRRTGRHPPTVARTESRAQRRASDPQPMPSCSDLCHIINRFRPRRPAQCGAVRVTDSRSARFPPACGPVRGGCPDAPKTVWRRHRKQCGPETKKPGRHRALTCGDVKQCLAVSVSNSACCCLCREFAHDVTHQGETVEIILAAVIGAAGTVAAAWIGRKHGSSGETSKTE
ncbi:hypothetical protein FHS41_008311 [Streptomyces violarus]|uniref:Uncharacterized protein n=1 Tax=Streptomyces violarus TaxID=67380 RepID=A0A7W5F6K1_9ACTN|nr:hypothetical protein [Streptomyces violarus]